MTLTQFTTAIITDDETYRAIIKKFNEVYEHLYALDETGLIDYDKAVVLGETFIKLRKDILGRFVNKRGDLITSDREVASYAIALTSVLEL